MQTVKAGAGKARIRIPEAVFPHENYTKEETPIHARVLVLDYTQRTTIVSLEMPSVRDSGDMDCLKNETAKWTCTKEKSVWVCTTHNLCTMHIPPRDTMSEKHDLFLKSLLEAIQDACVQALETMGPVRIGIGIGSCWVNTNRDIKTNQGWWNGLNGEGTTDRQLTVFRFERLDGTLVALLYHYPVKSCTAQGTLYEDGTRASSSELAGASSRILEEELGTPAIFFMGAAGDMVPRECALYSVADADGNLKDIDLGMERGFAMKETLGRELAQCVLQTTSTITCREGVRLAQRQVVFSYPGQRFYNEGHPYHPTPDYVYQPAPNEKLEVTALAIGNFLLLGLQPETTAITGMQLREKYSPVQPLLVSLVNGGKDYLADETAYERCTFCGTHSVFAKGGAERLVADVSDLIADIYQEKL